MARSRTAGETARSPARAPQAVAADREVRLPASAALSSLDETSFGIVVLNHSGGIIFSNQAADSILSEADALLEHHGHLLAASPAKQPDLGKLIASATGEPTRGSGSKMHLIPRTGRAPIVVLPIPLESSAIVDARGALLLYDIEAPIPLSKLHLQRLFGLTPAECDLCTALLEGLSLNAFAAERGVSRNTARTLLTRIFARTGQQRQSDLIKMLTSLSSLKALGAGFAAGMAAGLHGLSSPEGLEGAKLKLDTLARAELERFPDLEATVTVGEYTPGGVNKRHAHLDCLELIFVMQGAISTEVEGEGTRLTQAGEVLCLQPDILHQGRNASSTDPAKFVIVKLRRRGAATTVVPR